MANEEIEKYHSRVEHKYQHLHQLTLKRHMLSWYHTQNLF